MSEVVDDDRRKWTDEEIARLIGLWARVGSIALIAILMNRTTSSVQTRASRCSLPKRVEMSVRHRRRWTEAEDVMLDAACSAATALGRFDVIEVSEMMGRSVDTIINRMLERYGRKAAVFSLIFVDERSFPALPPSKSTKKCLRCRKPFHSEGSHNWVCRQCKAQPDDYC